MNVKIEKQSEQIEELVQYVIIEHIKEENEQIVENENQWTPVKLEDEENDYYGEFEVYDNGYDVESMEYVSTAVEYEDNDNQYYVEEGDDDDEDENISVYEEESDDDEETNGMDCEYNLDLEPLDTDKEQKLSSSSATSAKKEFFEYKLSKWFQRNYMKHECPVCKETFDYYKDLNIHMVDEHKHLLKSLKEENYILKGNRTHCKICNREIIDDIACYLHSQKHKGIVEKLHKNICGTCKFKSNDMPIMLEHITKDHPEIVEQYKNSHIKKNPYKCPVCSKDFISFYGLMFHIKDEHTQVYYSKYIYNCHLCKDETFNEEKSFLKHLMEVHDLNSWQILDYRKIFNDKEYFSCQKCHITFIENDIIKLLKHYLYHLDNCFWKCKFCNKQVAFNAIKQNHLCIQMIRFYAKQKKPYKKISNTEAKENTQKLKNLQEFQDYIIHVCPFCKEEFDKMIKWHQHLCKKHTIDTLKGLAMKVIPNENNKLRCLICHIVVINTPKQLHEHRFLHLPYHPYKCRHCSQTLNTFKLAVNHVLKKCNDTIINTVKDNDTSVYIQCPFCDYKKFGHTKLLYKHLEDDHNNLKEFFTIQTNNSCICKVCEKQFIKYNHTQCIQHINVHFNEKFFKCPMCIKSFKNIKICYRHFIFNHFNKSITEMQLLENEKQNECEENKLTTVTTLAKSSAKAYILNEFVDFISFACPDCNEGMPNQEDWHQHIVTKHDFFDRSNMVFKDSDGILKCTTCKLKMPTSMNQQQKHKLTHMPYRSFICTLCYARCNTLGVLYGHFRRRHFAAGSFKCYICTEILSTQYQRIDHIKTKHARSEWPRWMCLVCYKLFDNKYTLGAHMDIHDPDRLRYTCEVCEAKLIVLKDYRNHLTRHIERGETSKKLEDFDGINSQSSSKDISENLKANNLVEENNEDEETNLEEEKDEDSDSIVEQEKQTKKVTKKKNNKRKSDAVVSSTKKKKVGKK